MLVQVNYYNYINTCTCVRYISHFPIQRERLILTPHVWSCMLVFIRSLTQCIHNRPGIISDHEQLMFKIKVWMDGWMDG